MKVDGRQAMPGHPNAPGLPAPGGSFVFREGRGRPRPMLDHAGLRTHRQPSCPRPTPRGFFVFRQRGDRRRPVPTRSPMAPALTPGVAGRGLAPTGLNRGRRRQDKPGRRYCAWARPRLRESAGGVCVSRQCAHRRPACAAGAVGPRPYNGGHWPTKPSRSIWMTCLSVSPHLSITIRRDSTTVISRS
jgi:hypothetical protein